MRAASLAFFSVTLLAVSANAETIKPTIALAQITAPSDLEGARDAIASEVRASFEATGLFRIVKPEAIRTMTQVSPSAACPQNRCALRLGLLVDADLVLVGEVTKRGEAVNVALRVFDVRNGAITHRLAFEVTAKREELTRDVDAGVRSMLGLGIKKPQSADSNRIEMAAAKSAAPFSFADTSSGDVWRARFAALN